MAKELVYWKKNVAYTVTVRRNLQDNQGVSLNNMSPTVGIDVEDIRDFKIANKRAILEGLIVPTEAPEIDWETPNALTDEDITELLKNYLKLKNALLTIDSISTLSRMLEAAREQEKSTKIITLIKDRLESLSTDEVLNPAEMQGVGS